ncbi:MAG TPA: hypothetical protein PLD96_05020, partial [Methanothrix sp.]|nr:hypothetical protein [Methanothrix sp.]
ANLRARISQAERSYDFWFATTAPLAEMAGSNAPAGELGAAAMQGELLFSLSPGEASPCVL